MFDFSVSEIGLVGLVALVAIGPERLPKVARTAGVLFGRFRRYASSVKAEIEREIQQSELQALQQRMNQTAELVQQQVAHSVEQADQILHTTLEENENSGLKTEPVVLPSFTVPTAFPEAEAERAGLPVTSPSPQTEHTSVQPVSSLTQPGLALGVSGDPFSVRGAPRRSRPMQS